MRRGLKDGFTQPGLIVDEMLRPLQAAVDTPVAEDALLKPFASLPPVPRWPRATCPEGKNSIPI
nr:hypothetical protein [Tsuneonella flava]